VPETEKKLTFLEAAAIITGYGIGGGIMAVPYLASLSGMASMMLILFAAYGLSLLMHLMIAEIMLRDNESEQMVEVFQKYLFRGRMAPLLWGLFALIVGAFLASLSAYIAGGGEILHELVGLPEMAGYAITYAVAAGVVFFGLKALGVGEKYAVIGILILIGVFAFGAARQPFSFELTFVPNSGAFLALFGMAMFSFFAIFSVPQVVDGLRHVPGQVPKAVALGIGINAMVILALTVICMGVPGDVTRIAIIGLGKTLGGWSQVVGSLFILLAMLTSYWSVSFALAIVIQERLGWGFRISWLLATLPTFLIVISGALDFLGFMRLAGGAIAVLIALLVVPLLNAARKRGKVANPPWQLGTWGSWPFQVLVVIGYVLMAVGSMVSI
jgi:amino acid permease